jgi:hypothetical protein
MSNGIRIHSLKAWHDNNADLYNKTELTRLLISQSKRNGLSAEELSEVTGWGLHAHCSSALSRCLKKYDSIEYRPVEGQKYGRYYGRVFLL